MNKTILCIIRASTTAQETESQKRELVDFCKTKGFVEDEMEFIEVAGASARKLNKEYLQMLDDIKSTILTTPTIKTVALWHLNRLGRVKKCLTDMENFFVENQIQLYVKNGFDTPLLDENGKETLGASIAFSVYSAMVEEETKEMFAKMKRGKDRNREQGIYVGGQLKYGYSIGETKHLIINEDEAAIVRLIYELYATGKYSIYKLVDELNSRGVTKKGQHITFNIVRNCLADDSYYNGKLPLIDKELYDKCAAIKEEAVPIKRTRESQNVNFAVGLLKCHCGRNYINMDRSYTCYGKVKANRLKQDDVCVSPNIRRDVMDGLLWLVTKRLHQSFLMAKDSLNIQEYKDKENVLKLKVSTVEKDIAAIGERLVIVEDDYYIEGKMTEAQFNKRSEALRAKQLQAKSQLANLKNELGEVAKMIEQLELPANDKYLESILMMELDTEEYEDRKKIKDIMFQHIDRASIREFKEGKHTCIEITITAKTGADFVFVYDTWLNCHRKEECCVFYEGKPLYSKDGAITTLMKDVMDEIEQKAGLPILTNEELGIAAIHHIDRELGIAKDEVVNYRFTPDIIAVKEELDNPDIVAQLKVNYSLTDEAIDFIRRSGDTFSVGTPTDKIAGIINTLKSADVIEQIENVDIPNLTLGYGVKF